MPAPTVTGTPAGTTETTAATIDVTVTVPADANMILMGFGGFGGTTVTVTSVQGGIGGTTYDLNDLTLYTQRGTDQYAGIYAIDDQNVNWPGSGSETFRVTLNSGGRQLKAGVCCLKDVDTAGTYVNSSGVGSNAASTPTFSSITSSSNALNVACAGTYSADVGGGDDTVIYEEQNSTASSSLYFWHEAGTGATDTVEANASVAWAGVYASLEGTAGDTTVNATTDSLVITEYAATIEKDVNISATTDALVITEYPAAVSGVGATLVATPDTFDGTGALGSHWLEYQNSIHAATRVSGYMDIQVDDNTGDQTTWWNGNRGHMAYQRVRFPTGAIAHEYILVNAGVGPTSDPTDNLTSTGNPFNFCGLIVHDANTANDRYHFAVIGHRGTDAQSTVEHKRTYDGTSTQSDEGTDVFGTGVTHGDLAVELHSNGDMLFKRRPNSGSSWTYINTGSGLVQGSTTGDADLGSSGDEVLVGVIAYAYTTTGVPFVGTVDSFDAFDGTFETASLGITTYGATIQADRNVSATTASLTITTQQATIESGSDTNVAATTDALVITEYAASIAKPTNVSATTASLTITEYNATIAASTPDFTIDNQPTQTVSTAYGSLKIYGNGENWFTLE